MSDKTLPHQSMSIVEISQTLLRTQSRLDHLHHETESSRERMREFAHDILTPLNAMLGYSEALKLQTLGPIKNEKYLDYATTIHKASLQLKDLCEAVMQSDEHRHNNGVQPDHVVVKAKTVVNNVMSIFGEVARARGVSLKSEIADDFPNLVLPPQLIERVLNNLVSNALKFTPKGGCVTIKANRDEKKGAVMLVIRDTGVGIPADDILHVLKPNFTRPSLRGESGAGIGLTVVNRLLLEIGGNMSIRSHVDSGTSISLQFPRDVCR